MSEHYLSEIRMFSSNAAPAGWAQCDGRLLSIAQYDELFALIGTTYGGNGVTNFALPDLRGRSPLHGGTAPASGSYTLGQSGGVKEHALTLNELPAHSHGLTVAIAADALHPSNGTLLAGPGKQAFAAPISGGAAAMAKESVGGTAPAEAHNNLSPYLTVNFCIALSGTNPSRT